MASDAATYHRQTWLPIYRQLPDRNTLTSFKRLLYASTLRPALGVLKDGVVTIAEQVDPVLNTLTDRKCTNPFFPALSEPARDILTRIEEYRADPLEYEKKYADMSVPAGADDPRDDVLGSIVHVVCSGIFRAHCTWPGQFLVWVDRQAECMHVHMHTYAPEGTDAQQRIVQAGPSRDLQLQTWALYNHYQVSRDLRLTIPLASIASVGMVMCDSQSNAVLAISLNAPPGFERRRVCCSDRKRNMWRETQDFSPNHQLSSNDYIVLGGETKRLQILAACMLEACPSLAEKVTEGEISLKNPPTEKDESEQSQPSGQKKDRTCKLSPMVPIRDENSNEPIDELGSESEDEGVWVLPPKEQTQGGIGEIMAVMARLGIAPSKEERGDGGEGEGEANLPQACKMM